MSSHVYKRRVATGINSLCLEKYIYIDIWEHKSIIPPSKLTPLPLNLSLPGTHSSIKREADRGD
jgi:hypothetical protein